MLPGSRFGDDPFLSHELCQQTLSEHVVGFVCAAVKQIFPLQHYIEPRKTGKTVDPRKRRWPSRPLRERIGQRGAKIFPRHNLFLGSLELGECRDEKLRHVPPAVGPEGTDARMVEGLLDFLERATICAHEALATASKKAVSRAPSLTPGLDSTPLERSTP